MTAEDATLVESFVRRRDEKSFRRLYRAHTPMLFAMAVRLCGSRAEAEELTQETWVRAVERLAAFEARSTLRTWLTGILLNCFREDTRRRARLAPLDAEPDTAPPAAARADVAAAGVAAAGAAAAIDVERALAQLALGYREVVLLHDVNGYTHAEIAELLGIREGTSKSQLQRGRARLRELLTATSSREPT